MKFEYAITSLSIVSAVGFATFFGLCEVDLNKASRQLEETREAFNIQLDVNNTLSEQITQYSTMLNSYRATRLQKDVHIAKRNKAQNQHKQANDSKSHNSDKSVEESTECGIQGGERTCD